MTLVGRLGADPEISETAKGQVIRYVVGTSHGPRDNRQTSWFRVASFAQEGPVRDLVLGLSKGLVSLFTWRGA
jgi:single-stranded DNA-binding protein